MAIFMVAVLTLAGVAVTASQGAAASKHLTIATILAQDKLEQVGNAGYDLGLTGVVETTEAYGSIPDFSLYQRVVEVQPSRPVPGLQTATVTVSWADDQHSVTVSTVLAP